MCKKDENIIQRMAEDIYITLRKLTEVEDILWHRLSDIIGTEGALYDFIQQERQRFDKGTMNLYPVGVEYLEAYLSVESSYYCPFDMGFVYLFKYILPGTDRDYVVLAVQNTKYDAIVVLNNEFCMVKEAKDIYRAVLAAQSSETENFIGKIMERGIKFEEDS